MAKNKSLLSAPAPGPDITPVADPFDDVQPAAPPAPAAGPIIDPAPVLDAATTQRLLRQIAALEARVEELSRQQSASPVTAAVELDRKFLEYSEKCNRPLDVRVQEIVDATYRTGKAVYHVHLDDKNGQPRLRIPAETEADAVGRYAAICGLISFDRTKITVALAA